jgi:DNA-binding NarL/FixJ family response regulator
MATLGTWAGAGSTALRVPATHRQIRDGQAPAARALAPAAEARAATSVGAPSAAAPTATAAVTTVLVVDDHQALSGALAIAIDAYGDLRCVGTAPSLGAARPLVASLRPDVVLLDVLLPDGDGIDAIPGLLELHAGTRVLVLTGHTDVDLLSRAATRGASGFLPKESTVSAIIGAIRAAVTGQMLVDGATLAAILGRLSSGARRTPDETEGIPDLTRREADVLRLMGVGHDPHAIAKALGISIHTCRGYQKSMMAKLGAHSQLEAVVIGTRKGLIAR